MRVVVELVMIVPLVVLVVLVRVFCVAPLSVRVLNRQQNLLQVFF
jgi:hypothetical protein